MLSRNFLLFFPINKHEMLHDMKWNVSISSRSNSNKRENAFNAFLPFQFKIETRNYRKKNNKKKKRK